MILMLLLHSGILIGRYAISRYTTSDAVTPKPIVKAPDDLKQEILQRISTKNISDFLRYYITNPVYYRTKEKAWIIY